MKKLTLLLAVTIWSVSSMAQSPRLRLLAVDSALNNVITPFPLSQVGISGRFINLLQLPTTISGYGITDAYTKSQVNTLLSGIVGTTGATGATGSTGMQGVTGATGQTGNTGAVGATGVTGANGIQGVTGITGATGLVGATGQQGIQGVTGVTGAQGLTGIAGITGSTGVTGATGIAGTNGAQGIQGVTGATGNTGIQGLIGVTGVTGIQGIAGITGATGATGSSANVTSANIISALGFTPISISSIPTNVSSFTNDAGYLTATSPVNILSKTANYTIMSTDFATAKRPILLLQVDCTSASNTQTLPTSGIPIGATIKIIKTDATANTLTIANLSYDNIIGTKNWEKEVIWSGTNWIQN